MFGEGATYYILVVVSSLCLDTCIVLYWTHKLYSTKQANYIIIMESYYCISKIEMNFSLYTLQTNKQFPDLRLGNQFSSLLE